MAIKRTNLGSDSAGLALSPPLVGGNYYYVGSPGAVSTPGTPSGVGSLRLVPWAVRRALLIDRIGAEVTAAGDVGSKVRLGIYADTGFCYPGSLVVDAGQINGDSVAVQELTISQTIAPGLYWVGGVIQAATTTQPTLRITNNFTSPVPLGAGTALPAAGVTTAGYLQSGVTGALPTTFSATVSASAYGARTFFRVV